MPPNYQITRDGEALFIKELRLSHAASWKAVELFEREIRTLRQLDHRSIPSYREGSTETTDGGTTLRIVRAWVEGESLASLYGGGASFDEGDARALLAAGADVLAYLHAFRPPVVHRNLTPEHIIRDDEGQLHFVGFGGVQAVVPRTVGGSTFVGTSGFIPPEQLMGKAGPASDIYALAATCVSLLSGHAPTEIPAEEMRLQFEPYVSVSDPLKRLLRQMLDPIAERRPADGERLAKRLEKLDDACTDTELALIDSPPPDSLTVTATPGAISVRAQARMRHLLPLSTIGFIWLAGNVVGDVIMNTSMDALWVIALISLIETVVAGLWAFVIAGIPLLLFLFWPRRVTLLEDRLKLPSRRGSIPYSEIEEVYAQNGYVAVMQKGKPRIVSYHRFEPAEAAWLMSMLRRRTDDE